MTYNRVPNPYTPTYLNLKRPNKRCFLKKLIKKLKT